MQGRIEGGARGGFKDSNAVSGMIDAAKTSLGGSVTYSTLANVPKHKRQKLISEAKPMVTVQILIIT